MVKPDSIACRKNSQLQALPEVRSKFLEVGDVVVSANGVTHKEGIIHQCKNALIIHMRVRRPGVASDIEPSQWTHTAAMDDSPAAPAISQQQDGRKYRSKGKGKCSAKDDLRQRLRQEG